MLQTVRIESRSLCHPGQGMAFKVLCLKQGVSATGQGMNFRVLCFKQGIHFHYVAS